MPLPTDVICAPDAHAYERIIKIGLLITQSPDERVAGVVGSSAIAFMAAALRHPEWAHALIRDCNERAELGRMPGDTGPGLDFLGDMLPQMFPMELRD